MSVLAVIPVLDRPLRAQPLVESLNASVRNVEVGILFVCSPGDDAEIEVVHKIFRNGAAYDRLATVGYTVVSWSPGRADWAKKINWGYRYSEADWIFTGADDLSFRPGWADEALAVAADTGAQVVGTNDLGNSRVIAGKHATHNLVCRRYADDRGTIDEKGQVVAEIYEHNFVDDELVQTAKSRRLWAFAPNSRVEHLHPHWGKGEIDRVYEIGESSFARDRLLFHRRRARLLRA